MSFHVLVTGSLKLNHVQIEEWLTSSLMVDHLEWLTEADGLPSTLSTPEQLMAHLQDMTLAPHEILDVELNEDTLEVSAYLSKDAFEEGWAALSRLFSSAAGFEANGSLTALGFQGIQLGERISVSDGTATHRVLTLSERDSAQRDESMTSLQDRITQRFDVLVGRRPDVVSPGINPFTGR